MRQELSFYFIWHHPVAFRDFFIPSAWGKSDPYKTRLYQVPSALAKTKVLKTGRGIGKSLELEFSILQMALNKPNEETIISSFRRVHVKDRCEAIIKYLLKIPYLRGFVDMRRVNRTPIYSIPLSNGNIIYGASVGDDPNATSIIGKHPSTRAIDEMEVFPRSAWLQFVEARAERGSDDIFVGVPNGIIGMPFTDIQKSKNFEKCFFRISRTVNPFWDQDRKAQAITFYGAEGSDDYKQQIHGEDGSPVQGVWPMEAIGKAMTLTPIVQTLTPDDLTNPYEFLLELPYSANPIYIGIDAGYTEPTVIGVFEKINKKYRLLYRLNLRNKIIFDTQEEIIDYIATFYTNSVISIDTSILPNEFVFVKINGKVKYVRIEDLENINLDKLEVPTYENGKISWKKAKLLKHYYSGGVSTLRCQPGSYNVTVTDNHSVMVYNKNGIEKKLISNIDVLNDFLLTPKKLDFNNPYQTLTYRTVNINKYKKGAEKDIVLDEQLGYFLGWCTAEGSSKTTNYQLSLGNEEIEANELLQLGRKLFGFTSGYIYKLTPEYRNSHSHNKTAYNNCFTVLLGGGKNLKLFIENLVGIGSHNKKVPEVIFNSPESVQKEFLRGLLLGDGHTRTTKEGNTRNTITTISEELAKGLVTLLQMLGIYAEYSSGESYRITWSSNINKGRWHGIPYKLIGATPNGRDFRKVLSLKQIKHLGLRKQKCDVFNALTNYDWCFKKISAIHNSSYTGVVYDLEVEDNHTFVAGTGNILVHNTGADGRELSDALCNPTGKYAEKQYSERMVDTYFNKKVIKGYNVLGEPIEEDVKVFTTILLTKMFITNQFELPSDDDILEEFSQERKKQTPSGKVVYSSTTTDHIISMFRCFALLKFMKEDAPVFNTIKDYDLPQWGEGLLYGTPKQTTPVS